MFKTQVGGPIRTNAFNKRVWQPALKRAGITRPIKAMNLRHSGASLVHEAGFFERDIDDRQRRIADAIGTLSRPSASA